MKKQILQSLGWFLGALLPLTVSGAVASYDQEAALASATSDAANWMSYLPDNVYVAHVSIPGTHDTATAEGWDTSTGSTYSTTQAKTIDEQIAGGIRAFDFRPGLNGESGSELWCNHGTDRTKLKLADAMAKLTGFLDEHPSEFFVIHFFRGNVYSHTGDASFGVKLLGGLDSDKARQNYNALMGKLFNEELDQYIVDYSPYLRVKDVRGKIVLFRRDRIDFTHLSKAGNLSNWPGDTENWTAGNYVTATNASNPSVSGTINVTDVSSPENESQLQTELSSITNLYNYASRQQRPNEALIEQGGYKPFWVMCFTSGAYPNENSNGYRENASHTNPHLTALINNSEQPGPAGIVLSDWVLTDRSGNFDTKGVELVPAIYLSNFRYIKDFILDDELFASDPQPSTKFWEEGVQHFMRNVATGEFISAGAYYGTHSVLDSEGIRITPAYESTNNSYTLRTTFNGGYLANGSHYYVDTNADGIVYFKPTEVAEGRFVFKHSDDNLAIGYTGTSGFADGTEYLVTSVPLDFNDPAQQWELIPVDVYFRQQAEMASAENPVDVSYMLRGHRFCVNDADNPKGSSGGWSVTNGSGKYLTKTYKSETEISGTTDDKDKKFLMHCYNNKTVNGAGKYTNWSVSNKVTGLPAGTYRIYLLAAGDGSFNGNGDRHVYVNGTDLRDAVKTVSTTSPADVVRLFRSAPSEYTVTTDVVLDANGELSFEFSKPGTQSETHFFLGNIKIEYFGPTAEQASNFLQKVINETTAKAGTLSNGGGWSSFIAPYQQMVNDKSVKGNGYSEAEEIYNELRSLVYANRTDGADYTASIVNNSFELGEGYGWNYISRGDTDIKPNSNGTYTSAGCHGDLLFNTWNGDNKGYAVSQTIPQLPAGKYRLEALMTSDNGNTVRLSGAFGSELAETELSVPGDKGTFYNIAVNFTLDHAQDLTIAAVAGDTYSYETSGDRWFKADNFRLTLVEAATGIEWAMEIPQADYGTIMLPFDADCPDELELYETPENLVEDFVIRDVNHHVMGLRATEEKRIRANHPYMVKKAETALYAAGSRSGDYKVEGDTYTFYGFPTNGDTDTFTTGLLTGTHSGTEAGSNHMLCTRNGLTWFAIDSNGKGRILPHHAYINAGNVPAANLGSGYVFIEKAPTNDQISTGVESVAEERSLETADVYTLSGILLRSGVEVSDPLNGLDSGIYIVRTASSAYKAVIR